MNIVEAYSKKLAISEKVYANEHGGKAMSDTKKIAIARVLANTSEYITEAFGNSVGTQLSNMQTYKKFCLDLTTVALPSLIANDLVIVYPMKSRSGYIQYIQFVAGSSKGGVVGAGYDEDGNEIGEVFNDPFKLGKMVDPKRPNYDRVNYTAAKVVETIAEGQKELSWGPVVEGSVEKFVAAVEADEEASTPAVPAHWEIVDGAYTPVAGDKVRYEYDNVRIPQNDIPQLTARMEGKELHAKARRIAIYYSNMAAFQAKTEMGVDLGEILATQACGELSYEIDTEVVQLLDKNATYYEDLKFNKTLPVGVGKRDWYAGFSEILEIGSQKIYDTTQKHAANYMIASSSIKPVLSLVDGWKAASTSKVNGPYYAGEINGIKVYISPAIEPGRFVLGYNGGDMMTSAAVFAPYMAIVPTQLLGFADGAMSQGFSSLYDLVLLNSALLVAGKIVTEPQVVPTIPTKEQA